LKLKIRESTGIRSLNAAIDWVEDLSAATTDMRPFFKGLESDVIQEMKHEFDSSNPNKWQQISKEWKAQKRKEGKPENIGIYTGALMRAASNDAIKKYFANHMTWQIANCYSIGFTINRKLGITTREWLKGIGSRIIRTILAKARRK
jgi:hypothetical protein